MHMWAVWLGIGNQVCMLFVKGSSRYCAYACHLRRIERELGKVAYDGKVMNSIVKCRNPLLAVEVGRVIALHRGVEKLRPVSDRGGTLGSYNMVRRYLVVGFEAI